MLLRERVTDDVEQKLRELDALGSDAVAGCPPRVGFERRVAGGSNHHSCRMAARHTVKHSTDAARMIGSAHDDHGADLALAGPGEQHLASASVAGRVGNDVDVRDAGWHSSTSRRSRHGEGPGVTLIARCGGSEERHPVGNPRWTRSAASMAPAPPGLFRDRDDVGRFVDRRRRAPSQEHAASHAGAGHTHPHRRAAARSMRESDRRHRTPPLDDMRRLVLKCTCLFAAMGMVHPATRFTTTG